MAWAAMPLLFLSPILSLISVQVLVLQSKPRGPAHARALAAPTMGRCPRLRMLWVTPLMKGPARSVDSSRCVDCTSAMLSGIHPQHARVALDDVAQACLAVQCEQELPFNC